MKRILLCSFILSVSISITKAQSCFNVAAGNDTVISCLQSCLDVKAKIPDVRTTDDYQVVAIPYQPFPYVNPGGVVFNPAYMDDSCSDIITLPFTFCFYGVNYTQCVVGTNGILTFELSNANIFNAWFLNLGTTSNIGAVQPIPYPAGGTQNNPITAYYPRACIMGPYHDIDPEFTQPQPPGRRMEYIVVGTAPCRKFILNFNDVPYYVCPGQLVTQQMVLYEGTGIIDIFIKNKPIACAGSTNEGRAILGIQNWNRDKAVAVKGRNNTVWSAVNEGWRFIPSGGASLFNRVELHKNGNLVSTGSTTPLGTGELEVVFPNICQTENSADYVVKAFYKKCDDPLIETEGSDTIKVSKGAPAINSTVTNAPCYGNTGTITVTNPSGTGVEFSIDGGTTWQTSNIFTRPAGTYTIHVRDIGNNCSGSITAVITAPAALNAVATATTRTCAGNDGSIIITATGGTPSYFYSINGGATFLPGNTFNTAPGTYNNIIVRDANGCTSATSATVSFIDQLFLTLGNDTTICEGSSLTLQPQTNAQTNEFLWTPATFLNNSTVKNPVATPVDTIRYTLTATWGICQRTEDILVRVLHKPVVNAGKDTIVCNETTAFLNGSISNLSGNVNYAWSPVAKVAQPNALLTTAHAGSTQTYTLTATDNYGCNYKIIDDVIVTMRPPVIAFAGNDTTAVYGVPHQLSGSGGTNYLWSPAGSLNGAFLQNPQAILFTDTRFTLFVTNDIGCGSTDAILVKVYKGPAYYLPNAFTPNGDGLNDIFRPVTVGIAATAYFSIYNRYGELVFKTTGWMKGWDGNFKGKKATEGSYVWVIKGVDKDGKIIEMKGSVILVR